MLLTFIFCFLLTITNLVAQPKPDQYHLIEQKDSLYYLLTNNSLLKFYSAGESGEFFLTNYYEGIFPSSTKLILNDDYLFITHHDSIFYFSNENAWDLNYINFYKPPYTIKSIHPFGPYFFIRSGDAYHLLKIENGHITPLTDSLFIHPSQMLVFFIYPYVTISDVIYKYLEGFDFYPVGTTFVSNVNTAISGNKLISYFFFEEYPNIKNSNLFITTIEEPDFPRVKYSDWGLNIVQLHINFGSGLLIAKEKLYYMTWADVITTDNSQLAYLPSESDRAVITDYYIFLLGGDTLKFSKWNSGSTFYNFIWNDLTSVEDNEKIKQNFSLSQNYPNPFNPTTTIKYIIPNVETRRASSVLVTLKIYDVLGNEIAVLVNEDKQPGVYEVEFDGSNLSSGVYLYQIKAGNFISTKKMTILK